MLRGLRLRRVSGWTRAPRDARGSAQCARRSGRPRAGSPHECRLGGMVAVESWLRARMGLCVRRAAQLSKWRKTRLLRWSSPGRSPSSAPLSKASALLRIVLPSRACKFGLNAWLERSRRRARATHSGVPRQRHDELKRRHPRLLEWLLLVPSALRCGDGLRRSGQSDQHRVRFQDRAARG